MMTNKPDEGHHCLRGSQGEVVGLPCRQSISTSPDHRDQPASADSGYHSRDAEVGTVDSPALAGAWPDFHEIQEGIEQAYLNRQADGYRAIPDTDTVSFLAKPRPPERPHGSRSFPTPISSCHHRAWLWCLDRRTHGNTCSSWSNGYCPASEFWTSTTPARIGGRIRADRERWQADAPLDLQIAAIAVASGCILVTGNREHFANIDGLDVLDPLTDLPFGGGFVVHLMGDGGRCRDGPRNPK